jgi:hypothetical protein
MDGCSFYRLTCLDTACVGCSDKTPLGCQQISRSIFKQTQDPSLRYTSGPAHASRFKGNDAGDPLRRTLGPERAVIPADFLRLMNAKSKRCNECRAVFPVFRLGASSGRGSPDGTHGDEIALAISATTAGAIGENAPRRRRGASEWDNSLCTAELSRSGGSSEVKRRAIPREISMGCAAGLHDQAPPAGEC